MPRLVGMIAMSWALLVPGWLAAQTLSLGRESPAPSGDARSSMGYPWGSSAPSARSYPAAPEPNGVLPASYQTPVAATSLDESPTPHSDQIRSSQAPVPAEPASAVPMTAGGQAPLKLSPPGQSRTRTGGQSGGFGALVTIGSSLAIVLGLFFVVVWAMRRTMPAAAAPLPSDVVQVLGRTIVGHRQQLQLLRFGSRLLLVSVTPGGVETLAEIAEPDEVTYLAGLCQQSRPGSTTTAFRQVLEQLAGERTHAR
jgi:flagellar biogenesis protein FliO